MQEAFLLQFFFMPPIFLVLAPASGWKSAPLRLHYQCDASGIDTIVLSHNLLATNPGPPFLPMLVGSVCHGDELRVKVNTKAVAVLSTCLFVDLVATDWPHWSNLVTKESLSLCLCQAAPLKFLHCRWHAVYQRFTQQPGETWSLACSQTNHWQDAITHHNCEVFFCLFSMSIFSCETSNIICQTTEMEEMLFFGLPDTICSLPI